MINLKEVSLGPDEHASKAIARFSTSNKESFDCISFRTLGVWGDFHNSVLDLYLQKRDKIHQLIYLPASHPPIMAGGTVSQE